MQAHPTAPLIPPIPPELIARILAGETTLGDVPPQAHGYVLASLAASIPRPIVYVAPTDREMEETAAVLRELAPLRPILPFPAWDCLPYDRVSPAPTITAMRLHCLGVLSRLQPGDAPPLVLTTANAVAQLLPPRAAISSASATLQRGAAIEHTRLTQLLHANGYSRVGKVTEPGEYAVRGSLMDLFPTGMSQGVRLDFSGDVIESIRAFDPLSQRSDETLDSLLLQPVHEICLTPDTIDRFRARYRELFGAVTQEDLLYEQISAGKITPGMEHWLPLFYESLEPLSAYLPQALLCLDHRIAAMQEEREETIQDYYAARQQPTRRDAAPYRALPPQMLYLDRAAFAQAWRAHPALTLSPYHHESPNPLALRPAPLLHAREPREGQQPRDVVREYMAQSALPVILAANTPGSAERLAKMLELRPDDARVRTAVLPIEHGFTSATCIVLSEQDLLGMRIIRTQKRRRKTEAFMAEAANFTPGEAIVHREHGIGRFERLETVEVQGTRHDCLLLIYDGGDKLFLPVENIDLVTRYGTTEGPVALDKLGGVAWQKRKSALKKRLRMAAEALMKLAAERAATPAPVLIAPAQEYEAFVARFPYAETEDQAAAIEEMRADLAAGHAMDRLVCGDVGFGKTEVALRAAFIAAAQGYQVAVIAPTTLLARQHHQRFEERFAGLKRPDGQPYRLGALSRLVPAREAAATKTALAEGSLDIVIGTHALLAQDITLPRLALVVVDEEQHFGVTQKEKLKALKTNVHVLTLSATPIPRTLQLSLAGVRELSLITTPPIDRLVVRTYVMPYDPVVLREAMLREMHRGGRIFYVTPRVHHMAELEARLRELMPELKIAVAHGQMGAVALDRVMNAFYDGKYDLLLSTTIIESGIDVASANTIIIDRADMFGLAQLYQLRGRVGRGKHRAYAYLTLPYGRTPTRDAQRRLEVMQQLDTLGAGFQLASHDMDIRGFGNLLGEEQSGHIREVGIELYQSMLEEAVAVLKRKSGAAPQASEAETAGPQLNLGVSVLIPESYVEDLSLRLSLYRRAAGLTSAAEIEEFAAELSDRFGPVPQEVEQFLAVLALKLQCNEAGIARLECGPRGLVVAFAGNRFRAPQRLMDYVTTHAGQVKLRPDHTLFFAAALDTAQERLAAAARTAASIAALAREE